MNNHINAPSVSLNGNGKDKDNLPINQTIAEFSYWQGGTRSVDSGMIPTKTVTLTDVHEYVQNDSDHLDRQVYGVLLKKSCTTKMICAMLGDAYSCQRVRHSVIRLSKRRLIYYWGLDFCEVTGHKAYYLEVRNSRQKYLPKNRNSYGR